MNNGFTYLISLETKGSAAIDKIVSLLNTLETEVEKVQNSLSRMTNNFTNVERSGGSAIEKLTSGFRNLVLGVGAVEIARKTMQWTAGLEQTNLSFEVMLKSADKAKSLVTQLTKFADITPFDDTAVLGSAKTLLAMGVSSEKLMGTLTMVGNVASGVSAPLGEMSAIFGKMKTGVVVHNDDLQQLSNRGIPILSMLADKYHTNTQTIIAMAEKGKLSFGAIEDAFRTLSGEGGLYANMMARQSETLAGKWSTFSSAVQRLATNIGTQFLPTATNLLNNYLIPSVEWIGKNIDVIGGLAVAFGSAYLGMKTYAIWQGIAGAVTLASTFMMGGFTTGVWALNAALWANPIGLIVGLIVGLGAAAVYAWNKFDSFRGGIMGTWGVIKEFGSILYDYMIMPLMSVGKTLLGVFTFDYDLIKSGISDGIAAAEKLTNQYQSVGQRLGNAFNDGWNSTITGKASAQINKTDAVSSAFGGMNGGASGGGSKNANIQQGIENITGGGAKQTTINISISKMEGVGTIQVQHIGESIEKIGDAVLSKLTQVINNAQQMQ